MKKQDLATLAMIGISAGLMIGGCQQKQQEKKGGNREMNAHSTQEMSPNMQAFYSTLSSDGQRQFMELDSEHRKMAVDMMEQKCQGKNMCKGLGGCATDKNSCAGMNGCKGKGGPPVKSADKAVEAQRNAQIEKNADKRVQTSGINGDLSPDMQTFYNELSPDAQRKFMALDAQHKMMAIEMSKQECSSKNACKGMGGCATDKNSCAGQNGCKGEGGPPVNDPNEAVEVQYRNQTGQNNP
ncbi:MAG: hypothetical protein KDK55_06725 [Chlamydiia bacterium]|nr:hypothetical protein [Chlamydiia bacterium]